MTTSNEHQEDDEGVATSTSGVVPAHKQNTILKLVARHWSGRLSKEALAARLDPEIWAAIQNTSTQEEMLRRAKTATNKILKGLRQEKHVQRQGDRACQGQSLLDKYGLLAAMAPNITEEECWRPAWVSEMPKPCIPELNCLPLRGYFDRRDWTLLKRELAKLHEKRRQIEYLVGLVLEKLDARRRAGLPAKELVDFAGGRGDLALALGWVLHGRGLGERLTVVELKREYVAQGQRRVQEAGLSGTVRFLELDIKAYGEHFDVAVACHACGGLIDLILAKCIATAKISSTPSFVLLTCCFGKIKRQADAFGLQVPFSGGTAVETQADFWALCGLADSAKPRESTMAMRVLNSDRIAVCRRAGIWVDLRSIPREVTNKNIVLSDAVRPSNVPITQLLDPPIPLPLTPRPAPTTWPGVFRVVAISDTHGRHDKIHVPPADLLLHCGDFTRAGEESEVAEFAAWLHAQPCTHKVIVAGNHEVTFDAEYFLRDGKKFHSKGRMEGISDSELDAAALRCRQILLEKCPAVHILHDEEIKVGPVRVWGSPCQGHFYSGHTTGAFTLPAACPEMETPWWGIPDGVDIVITHGPPFGIMDLSGSKEPGPQHAGCPVLRDHIIHRVRPIAHVFGHIHEGYGAACAKDNGVIFVNAAMCTERYLATRLAVVMDLPLQESVSDGGSAKNFINRSRQPDVWLASRAAADALHGDKQSGATAGSGTKTQTSHSSSEIPPPLYDRLVGALHGHPKLHAGSGTSGYRNKASYLLGADFPGENPMCAPALNKVAAHLQALALREESNGSGVEWVEAALKLTRTGSVGVKLLLRGFQPSSVPEWLPELLRDCPEVVSVSGQLCPEGSKEKPAKSPWDPRYVDPFPIHGPLYIIEEAPPVDGRSGVQFRLSPDAFSEVNSPAEDAMFDRVVKWVKPLRSNCPRLALQGRNSGFYGLALQREFKFEEVRGCTHCPQTCGDARASIEMHAGEQWLPGGEATFKMKLIPKTGFADEIRALAGGPPTVVHVTNNRHGLKSEVVKALQEVDAIRGVVYNSCNHGCLAREWTELCSGGFEIAEFASSDLLAGTEFDSSIFLLLRRPRTLLLPIGPPASGKSALARGLSSAGSNWDLKSVGAEAQKGKVTPGQRSREVVRVFERDRVFANERAGPGGLRGAKGRTHEALLDALAQARNQTSAALYVDSTNGAQSARLAYREALQPERTVYLLLGLDSLLEKPKAAENDVLERILARHRSSSCPAHETRQWEESVRNGLGPKIERLLASVEAPGSDELAGDNVVVLRCQLLPSQPDLEALLWQLFLLMICPALLRVEAPKKFGLPHPLHSIASLQTTEASRRVALCFLTSARARPRAVADAGPTAEIGSLWNDPAWQLLASDFEARSGALLDSAFCVLSHDDSRAMSEPEGSFLARASAVSPVPTQRATISLVLAELCLLREALEKGCEYMVLLSGSCLPLCRLDTLQEALLASGKSIVQYHFCKGGHQRLFGIRYGALQWKVWHRREAAVLAALDEHALLKRWQGMEEGMQRYNLAPDEVVLINELCESLGQAELEARCERRAVTFLEWEDSSSSDTSAEALPAGPRRARTFAQGPPEAAWAATQAAGPTSAPATGALFCRKVAPLSREALEAWSQRLSCL